MKKWMILAILSFVATAGLLAQPNKKQRINAAKVAYITDRLKFTEKESAAFWPIYNRFEEEKKAINQKYSVKDDPDWMPDTQAEQAMLDRLQMEEDLTKLKRAYYWEFKKAIPPSKIAMLTKAEREFKKMVRNRMQNKRNPNAPNNRPNGN